MDPTWRFALKRRRYFEKSNAKRFFSLFEKSNKKEYTSVILSYRDFIQARVVSLISESHEILHMGLLYQISY